MFYFMAHEDIYQFAIELEENVSVEEFGEEFGKRAHNALPLYGRRTGDYDEEHVFCYVECEDEREDAEIAALNTGLVRSIHVNKF